MKTTILTLAILIVVPLTLISQEFSAPKNNSDYYLDSSIYYTWDVNQQFYKKSLKTIYEYDARANLILAKYFEYETDHFQETSKTEFFYFLSLYLSEEIYSYLDLESMQYIKESKKSYSYNLDNKILEIIYHSWDDLSSSWYAYSKQQYEYNPSGSLASITDLDWIGEQNNWVKTTQEAFIYNDNGTMHRLFYYSWDPYYSLWTYDVRITYEYFEDTLVVTTNQYFIDSTMIWRNSLKCEYRYNETGSLFEMQYLAYYPGSGVYHPYYKILYNIDDYGNSIQEESSVFYSSSQEWMFVDKTVYSWSYKSTHIAVFTLPEPGVYPNPTYNYLFFSKEYPLDISSIELFSESGQLIMHQPVKSNSLDIESVLPGIYFLKINSDNTSKTIMVIKK